MIFILPNSFGLFIIGVIIIAKNVNFCNFLTFLLIAAQIIAETNTNTQIIQCFYFNKTIFNAARKHLIAHPVLLTITDCLENNILHPIAKYFDHSPNALDNFAPPDSIQ